MAQAVATQRHQQHQAADFEDVELVAADDALVDDVRHQARQQQVGERLREGQDDRHGELATVGTEEAREFQHRRCGAALSGQCEILAELLSLANS